MEDHTAKTRKRTNAKWVVFNRKSPRKLSWRKCGRGRTFPLPLPTGSVLYRQDCRPRKQRMRLWPTKTCLLAIPILKILLDYRLGGRHRCSCGLTPWAKVRACTIFFHHRYTSRQFAFRLFPVNSKNSPYKENLGFKIHCKRRNFRRRKVSYFSVQTLRMELNLVLSEWPLSGRLVSWTPLVRSLTSTHEHLLFFALRNEWSN